MVQFPVAHPHGAAVRCAVHRGLAGGAHLRVDAELHRHVPGNLRYLCDPGGRRVPVVAALATLLQPALHALHHPGGSADLGRSSPALCGFGVPARHRVAAHERTSPSRSDEQSGRPHRVDGQGRLRRASLSGGPSWIPSFDRAGAMVAFQFRLVMAHQRADLLRAAVRHGPVGTPRPHLTRGVSQRRVHRHPVPQPAAPDERRVHHIQRATAAGLLHHRVHRRPARVDHRPAASSLDRRQVRHGGGTLQPAGGTDGALRSAVLDGLLHLCSHGDGHGHRRGRKSEPHHPRHGHDVVLGHRHLPGMDGGGRRPMADRVAVHDPPPARSPARRPGAGGAHQGVHGVVEPKGHVSREGHLVLLDQR